MDKDTMAKAEWREQFLRHALVEAKREMRITAEPGVLHDLFLLTAMGVLGVTSGFFVAIERKTLRGNLISRGMPESEIRPLRQNLPDVVERYFSDNVREDTPLSHEVTLVPVEQVRADPYCPIRTQVLLRWSGDGGYSGMLGLGNKLSRADFDAGEIRFLSDLTANLLYAMDQMRSATDQRAVAARLATKEEALRDATKTSAHNREMLNRRIFHLRSLYEMSRELSGLKAPQEIIGTFLMMILGIFSSSEGYILLLDRDDTSGWMASRGIHRADAERLEATEAKPILRNLSDLSAVQRLASTGAKIVTDIRILEHPLCSVKMAAGLLFSVDDAWIGLVGLGNRLTGEAYAEADQELLSALAATCLSALQNARSFHTIQNLNTVLAQQNVELSRNISDLKASRQKIEVLERAKEGIRSIIRRETERSGRVKLLDIVMVLLIGTALGLVFNIANPAGIDIIPSSWSRPPLQRVALLPAYARIKAGTAVLVDARPSEFFEQKHIRDAVNLPLALFDFIYMMKFGAMDPQSEIIVYGRSISRHYDEEVADKLINRGHSRVFILEGGLSAWEKNRYPLEKVVSP